MGEALDILVRWWAGRPVGPPQTDIRRHPIRLSLGELVSTRARFRLAGQALGYTVRLLAAT